MLLAGPDALGSLELYLVADRANDLGAAGFIEAAVEYLCERYGVEHPEPPASPESRDAFAALLKVAERLRAS